jgi:hypothetical protein
VAVSAPTQIGSYASTANVTTSGARALTGTAAVGDLVIVSVAAGAALLDTDVAISDSNGHTWTLVDAQSTTGTTETVFVFATVVTAALDTSDTFTVTRASNGGLAWVAQVVTGANGVTADEIQAANVTSNNSAVSTASITAVADSLVMLHIVTGIGVTGYTPGTGYTNAATAASSGSGNPRRIGTLYRQVTTAETTTPSATTTGTATAWAAIAVNIAPAVAGTMTTTVGDATADGGTATMTGGSGGTPGTMTTTAGDAPASGGTASLLGGVAHPTVAIIGDSLTYRADDVPANSRETLTRGRFDAAGWDDPGSVYWWGRGGKNMHAADSGGKTVSQNITDALTQMGTSGVDQWIIALGTNDVADGETQFRSEVSAILDLIFPTGSEATHVYWPTFTAMNAANTNYLNITSWLRSEVAARTDLAGKVHIIEWADYIHSAGVYDDADWLAGDVPHMTPQGYEKRDLFFIANLTGSTMVSTAGDGAASGGTATMSGGATITATAGDAPADGGTATMTGGSSIPATMTASAGDAPAAGGTATLTGAGTLAATAGDAAADGGTATLSGAATFSATSGGATGDGGTAVLTGAAAMAALAADANAAGGLAVLLGAAPVPDPLRTSEAAPDVRVSTASAVSRVSTAAADSRTSN